MTRTWILVLCLLMATHLPARADVPAGAWTDAQAEAVLAKTLRLRLAVDLSHLSEGERTAVDRLLRVGEIFHELYEESRHHQARSSLADLRAAHRRSGESPRTARLLDLYRLFRGPIATTLENTREPFLPVDPVVPGKNVYPLGLAKPDLQTYLDGHPEQRRELLHLRSVVRRVDAAQLAADLAVLDREPALDTLHPGLRARLEQLRDAPADRAYYALPYSVAYADRILEAFRLLHEAADAVRGADPPFARFLASRARDLLTDDYDAGDAAWVTGRFHNLNAQIGAYETYDDEIYGVKAFFSLSLLLRDRERSAEMAGAIGDLQALESALPYDAPKQVDSDIPVGVYEVIADFGQARGTNTATILPNEAHLARQYGRTILLRSNIMRHPTLFEESRGAYRAAVVEEQADDLDIDGNFYRTLWHEIGHYLGADQTADGRTLGESLADASDLLEEMKADLVSLHAVQHHLTSGLYDARRARSVYASGIRRVLQKRQPRRSQPYGTMQLMQWNWFLEHGLLEFDRANGRLRIHYDRYPETVTALLGEVLSLQRAGDSERAQAFIARWTAWDEELHGVIAQRMRDSERFRYRLVRYAALGE